MQSVSLKELQAIADSIASKAGLYEGPAVTVSEDMTGINAYAAIWGELALSPDVLKLPMEAIKGVIAHEMAHFVQGWHGANTPEREIEADAMASYFLGSSQGLITALQATLDLQGETNFATTNHPLLAVRIARLKQMEASQWIKAHKP